MSAGARIEAAWRDVGPAVGRLALALATRRIYRAELLWVADRLERAASDIRSALTEATSGG